MAERVLFFHENKRTKEHVRLLAGFREARGWDIGIVGPAAAKEDYQDLLGAGAAFFPVPDLGSPRQGDREPEALEALLAYVAECEQASGVAANRIILSNERNTGRAYSFGAHYFPASRLVRDCLADSEKPRVLVARTFGFMKGLFDRFDPQLVLAGIRNNPPAAFVAGLIARERGIPFLTNRRSKVLHGRCYWTSDFDMYNPRVEARCRELEAAGEGVTEEAREFIARFRKGPETSHYTRANWKRMESVTWLQAHRRFLGLAREEVRYLLRGGQGDPPKKTLPRVMDYYRSRYLKIRQASFFACLEAEELAGMRYVYYPMHKEPELALNYLAPLWHDQRHAVAFMSAMLPIRYRLLVREHRANIGRRPTGYYQGLSRLPGVTLIHAFDDQFKYIRHADLILTDNGSAGWEGLLLGRPVMTLARTFYDGAGLARRLSQPADLEREIIQCLTGPKAVDGEAYDRRLGRFIDAEGETTFSEEKADPEESLRMIDRLVEEGGQG